MMNEYLYFMIIYNLVSSVNFTSLVNLSELFGYFHNQVHKIVNLAPMI